MSVSENASIHDEWLMFSPLLGGLILDLVTLDHHNHQGSFFFVPSQCQGGQARQLLCLVLVSIVIQDCAYTQVHPSIFNYEYHAMKKFSTYLVWMMANLIILLEQIWNFIL